MSGTEVAHAGGTRVAQPPSPPGPRRPGHRDLRTLKVMWQREMIRFLGNRLQIGMGLLTPLMFLLILGTGLNEVGAGGGSYQGFLFPGVLMMALQAPAIAVGAAIVWDRQTGFLRQMLVAPVRRGTLLLGICLGGATTGAAYAAMVLATAGIVGIPYRAGMLLVLLELALISFAFTAMGVLAAVCITRPQTFQIAVSLAMMPMLFLSGAMFPASGLPGWLGTAVLLNPLTYGVDAVRRTLPGDGVVDYGGRAAGPELWGWAPPVALEVGLIAVLALLAVAVAGHRFTRAA
ncbi:ABC transporter permease [Streptomyces uncialis]|uniref:ABC transporter permease n=1 Tax=Streptomyces uncialis TaxID=1048205 RepID=UPI002255193F|nr:ABC transporter permease [Streptomyces uncialis]MCX4661903.1 ABC transporter permease [Streptomyces uncialis]